MTMHYGASPPDGYSEKVLSTPAAVDCLLPMGITSENVASDFGVPRAKQDEFAARSFQKAAAAQKAGKVEAEILPIQVSWTDPKTQQKKTIVVDRDDGTRDGVTAESLAKLKPVFVKDGCTHAGTFNFLFVQICNLSATAGNASQISDGAAAVLLARRSVAKRLGLPIVGKFVFAAVVGVPPRIMGVGPLYAIPKVLDKVGLAKQDVDFFEINEAFASQALYCIDQLGIPYDKVNPHGGAIAIGHPLGCSKSPRSDFETSF